MTITAIDATSKCLVLRNELGEAVGVLIDPEISADDVEWWIGLKAEEFFVEPHSPICDIVNRVAAL